MRAIFRSILIVVCCSLATSGKLSAQNSPLIESFSELVQEHAALISDGRPESDQVELVATWVQANDWRALPLEDQTWLHARLLALDQVNPAAFSVRWSGFITAPTAGTYVFTQHHLPGAYTGTLKLSLDRRLVLDTTEAPKRLGWGPELAPPVEGAYRSQPVELAAGQTVSIDVDYVYHDKFPRVEDQLRRWRFPLPLLLWETAGAPPQIISRDVLTPPTDFDNSGNRGLRANYFRDTEFSALAGSFTEPGVQLIWNQRVILPRFKALQEMVLGEIRNRIIAPPPMPVGDVPAFVQKSVGQTLPGLSAADRELTIRNLCLPGMFCFLEMEVLCGPW